MTRALTLIRSLTKWQIVFFCGAVTGMVMEAVMITVPKIALMVLGL